jgi:hypothetical protein
MAERCELASIISEGQSTARDLVAHVRSAKPLHDIQIPNILYVTSRPWVQLLTLVYFHL